MQDKIYKMGKFEIGILQKKYKQTKRQNCIHPCELEIASDSRLNFPLPSPLNKHTSSNKGKLLYIYNICVYMYTYIPWNENIEMDPSAAAAPSTRPQEGGAHAMEFTANVYYYYYSNKNKLNEREPED